MRVISTMLVVTAFLTFGCSNSTEKKVDSSKLSIVDSLLSQMTIKEKVGQMTQLNLDVVGEGGIYTLEEPHRLNEAKLRKAILEYSVGSILNCGGHAYPREQWHELIGGIQEMAVNEGRLGIPILYGIDAIHGANYTMGSTLFPQQLAQAATWNPELVKNGAAITAYEVKASGIPWNFSPVLDLGRDARWSRLFETYGEDVLLAKTMGQACVEGYQGESLDAKGSVAACMKHFLAYSMPRTGKDRTPVYLHERQLREYFLPTFKAAIESGAATVMINSGEINGIPVHADKAILTDLLRDELGFEGLAVTDWEDIMKLNNIHKVAPTMKDAVRMAIEAGIDMSMVPNDYEFSDLLFELVEEGTISEERLDMSVRRILQLKLDLGLFDNAMPPSIADYPDFNSNEFKEAARKTAAESITLLENDGILPLNQDLRIFVTGPGADNMNALNGAWTRTWQGTDTTWNDKSQLTILDALENNHKAGVSYMNSVSYDENAPAPSAQELFAMKKMAAKSDVILLCLAESPSTEKVGDIDDLALPMAQRILAEEMLATGVPVIVVMTFNRPRIVSDFIDEAAAVILTYLPGDQGGIALEQILHGEVNPSGNLPFTYPRHSASLFWYDHKSTERLDQKFGMDAFNPQWEFGDGLSYTQFDYSALSLSADTIGLDETIEIKFELTNSGQMDGMEVVQCYFSDRFAEITPSIKRLRAFDKALLQAGEVKQLQMSVPTKDLMYIGKTTKPSLESGWFDVSVGSLRDSIYVSID